MPPYKIPCSVLVVVYTTALEVLLLRRAVALQPDADDWQSVTGSLDAQDEPYEAAARREVFEETGIDARAGMPLATALHDWGIENVYPIYPAWRHRYAPGVWFNTEHVFGLQLSRCVPVQLSCEHTAWQWLPWREAADVCTSSSNAEAIRLLPQFLR